MSIQDVISLLPLFILTAMAVIVMLAIAFWPNRRASFWLTLSSLILALAALVPAASTVPRHVTDLFVVDKFALFYMGLILAGGLVTTALSRGYMDKYAGNRGEYFLLIMVATLGASLLAISSHFISFFLGTGIVSLSLYTLIAYNPSQRQRIEASLKYLILVGAATAILLFGMALIYATFGSMQFEQISIRAVQPDQNSPFLLIGFGLLIAGISFELALVPFHMWTPDVYQGAPAPVTGFIATVAKAGIFALMLRLFSHASLPVGSPLWNEFAAIAILSMLVGNVAAVIQKSVKRLLAYSSIAHLGYLMVPFLAQGQLSPSAIGFYWVVYFITTLLAFGIVAAFSDPVNELDDSEAYRGMFKQHRWPAVMFGLALLSLMGLPPTGGLVGKVYLFAAGVQGSVWLLVAALVVGSVIGFFYYIRVVILMFSAPPSESTSIGPTGKGTSVVLSILTGILIILGLFPTPLIGMIAKIITNIL